MNNKNEQLIYDEAFKAVQLAAERLANPAKRWTLEEIEQGLDLEVAKDQCWDRQAQMAEKEGFATKEEARIVFGQC